MTNTSLLLRSAAEKVRQDGANSGQIMYDRGWLIPLLEAVAEEFDALEERIAQIEMKTQKLKSHGDHMYRGFNGGPR